MGVASAQVLKCSMVPRGTFAGVHMRVQKPYGFRHQRDTCRREGCGKPATNGYCSREHAPYGNLSDAPDAYIVYPMELEGGPPTTKAIHAMACVHMHADPYTCRSVRLRIPRAKMQFKDRCLCHCHNTTQSDQFEDYE